MGIALFGPGGCLDRDPEEDEPGDNRMAIIPTPVLMLPLTWETALTIAVPMNEAPLPQMSISPKYSPDFSGGTIFANQLRERACTPPWNIPTQTARNQKWACSDITIAKRAMPV